MEDLRPEIEERLEEVVGVPVDSGHRAFALADVEEGPGQGIGAVGGRSGSDGDCNQQEGEQSPHWLIAELVIVAMER